MFGVAEVVVAAAVVVVTAFVAVASSSVAAVGSGTCGGPRLAQTGPEGVPWPLGTYRLIGGEGLLHREALLH
jgi:hypothetical protein